jgi:hypothetical protein
MRGAQARHWQRRPGQPLLALLLAASLVLTGCSHFIVRDHNNGAHKTFKVATRLATGVATLGGTEVYVYRAKKNEEIARAYSAEQVQLLEEQRDSVTTVWWVTIGLVVIVTGIVLIALSEDGGGGGGGGGYCREVIHTPPGTCSWHGGVAGCAGGVAVCADGQYSPGRQWCYEECV